MARPPRGAWGCRGVPGSRWASPRLPVSRWSRAGGVPPQRDVPRFTSRLAGLTRPLPLAAALGLFALLPQPALAGSREVVIAHLEGEINAATANYVAGVVAGAGADQAGALVIVTNTPGGLSTSMDDIVTNLLNATVPVVVYVAPAGARAASAGLFVAQAADVVAMAPGTNIGSAHPITGSGGDIGGDLGRKVLNDAVARIRNLASLHHRNADWCESAVRESANIGVDEATRIGVADLRAPSLDALLLAVDGRVAPRPSGSDLSFHTAGARQVERPMTLPQQILQTLIDPNVAYLLLLVAIFGLIAEVTTPGAILPGVVGGISAMLALVALSTLPINVAGVLLMGFAFFLFVVDIKAPTHGVLTLGGLVSLLLGSAVLLNTGPVDLGIDWRLIVGATLAVAAGFFFVVRKAARARSRQESTSAAALIGSLGEARGPLSPAGQVFVAGAVWPAVSASGPIPSGHTVRVISQERRSLEVEAVEAARPETGSGAEA